MSNEREPFEIAYTCAVENGWDNPKELARYIWDQAGAAYQRTQAQPADAYRMARALSDRYADQCRLDKDDYWKLYGQDCIDDVRAMLEGAKHE